ncbi:hypothetical protein ACR77J_08075 [Tissierella praeacuta]|uniref:hypothetical protein n=1 Tax=Tissierella praeacuta TaxID=43131 RepID=UPI003DA5F1DB
MKDYSQYRPPSRDTMLWSGRKSFQNHLNLEGKNILVDDKPEKGLVRYHTNPINEFKENRKITLWHQSKLKRGSYVKTIEDGRVFLTISEVNQNDIVKYALIRECNHNLKFIDLDNNLIVRPCIVSAKTLYTTGIKDEKVIEIPNGMVGIQLPYDEDTKKLDRQQAFVFNKAKYEITFYNEVEFDGLIVLICTEIGTSHLDDKVNEIADRWVQVGSEKIDRLPWLDNQQPPEEPETPTEPIAGIRYEITPILQYQDDTPYEIWHNSWQKYTIKKFVDDVEVNGNFTFTLSDTKATISEITNNLCKVSVWSVIGKHIINLIVTDTDANKVAIEKSINIIGK